MAPGKKHKEHMLNFSLHTQRHSCAAIHLPILEIEKSENEIIKPEN